MEETPTRRPGRWMRRRFGSERLSRLHITSLTEMLDRLELAQQENGEVSVGAMLEATGRRSFGPLLLVPGLLVLSPLSGIPGVPTLAGCLVLLITVQLLAGREWFWLPRWILNRTITHQYFMKVFHGLRPFARITDKMLRPRLVGLTQNTAVYVVALVCLIVAITMPPLELVPFAATSAGVALTTFGLALIGHDGLLMLVGLLVIAVSILVVAVNLL